MIRKIAGGIDWHPNSLFSLPYAHVDGSRHSSDHFRCGSYGYASSPLGGVDNYDIYWCPCRRRNINDWGSDRHENRKLRSEPTFS